LHLVIIAMDIHLFLERGTPAGPPNCVVSSMFLSTLCVIYCYFIWPIGSIYAIYISIYGNIYHQYTPNVSIYTSTMDPSWVMECAIDSILRC
jgi:hypothetical protein